MVKKLTWLIGILVAGVMSLFPGFSSAAEFPTKNIELLAPYGVTAASALSLRIVGEALSEVFGHRVLIVPAAGGGGTVAASRVARAKPDGYTLIGANPATNVINLYLKKDTMYKISDFEFLAQHGVFDLGLAVKPNSPFKTVDDYLEYAKKNPSSIKQAISGFGTMGHLCLELLKIKAGGLKIDIVPFNTPFDMRAAVLGGHCDAAFVYGGTGGESDEFKQILEGGGKMLAVATKDRLKPYPDIPTLTEKKLDLVFITWWGIAGPKGMPKEVSQTLKNALYKVLKDPQVIQRIERVGLRYEFRNSEEFTNEVKETDIIIKKIFEEAKIQTN